MSNKFQYANVFQPLLSVSSKAQNRGPKYRDPHHFIRQKYPYTFYPVTGSPCPPDLIRLDSRSKLPHSTRPDRRRNQPSAGRRAPFSKPTIKVHLLLCIFTSFLLSFLVFFFLHFFFLIKVLCWFELSLSLSKTFDGVQSVNPNSESSILC